ncbi:MAG: aromatic ring-hydroxylating dioxygenase subunit alpha, partial [Saprospiraceae bacterium]|nr:aromatic ring-hydroxylating dioxygenase subunit alpha [Saprospiraceae bacterium]
MANDLFIHPQIEKAETLPSSFYKSDQIFKDLKEKVFLKTWQFIGDENDIKHTGQVTPINILDEFLNESILLARDESDKLHCFSNVCTHRGNRILNETTITKKLVCQYHGRRFGLDGQFEFMPEFENAEDFPRECDNLHRFPLIKWGPLLFAGFDINYDFQNIIKTMEERVGFLPLNDFVFDPTRSKDYVVKAHWALYCDNYLEGFHIPYVHKDLNKALDYENYSTELYTHCNLQIGYADDNSQFFEFPVDH